MKHLKHIKLFAVVLLIGFVLNQFCFAEDTIESGDAYKSYSNLLKKAVRETYDGRSVKPGYRLPFRDGCGMMGFEKLPQFRMVKGLDVTDAVPFLIDVIDNGPDWPVKGARDHQRLAPHIGRCYAALCLASTKDAQAYPVLTELLQNGVSLIDPNGIEYKMQEHDIRSYAAVGLGILGDNRAADLLIKELGNANTYVQYQSMLALALINDARTIGPILDAAFKYKIDSSTLYLCMWAMTKFKLETEWDRDEKTVAFPAFPELGSIKTNKEPHKTAWVHWYKVAGRQRAKQQFENKYNKWKGVKTKHPKKSDAVRYAKRKLSEEVGVAALPLVIEKIKKGETDLIDIVSKLTDSEIKKDATKQEVLLWWEKNKEKWTIFPEKQ